MKKRAIILLIITTFLFLNTINVYASPIAKTDTIHSYIISTRFFFGHNKYDLSSKIASIGGTVTKTIPEIEVLVVKTSNPDFKIKASRLPGVRAVFPNIQVSTDDTNSASATFSAQCNHRPKPPVVDASNDTFFNLQWGLQAIKAPEAWKQGQTGAGVRVAVLDGGFDLDHPDLVSNINFDLSKSFVEGENLSYALPDQFSHGTHLAGIIAAADNNLGIVGVAPRAELVLLKVLKDQGTGEIADTIEAIIYAAKHDVDVVDMGYGILLPKKGNSELSKLDIINLTLTLSRAVDFATWHNTTLIASAGDGHSNLNKKDNIHIPSDIPGVISISATAPIGWAVNPKTNLDVPATDYTNFGDRIDFAAPGGNNIFPGDDICTVGSFTQPCWVFDMVFSTGSNLEPGKESYFWSTGTGQASAFATGVVALMVGKNRGHLNPFIIKSLLIATADDLGPKGKDPYFGFGRVNAKKAVEYWNRWFPKYQRR